MAAFAAGQSESDMHCGETKKGLDVALLHYCLSLPNDRMGGISYRPSQLSALPARYRLRHTFTPSSAPRQTCVDAQRFAGSPTSTASHLHLRDYRIFLAHPSGPRPATQIALRSEMALEIHLSGNLEMPACPGPSGEFFGSDVGSP